MYLDNNNNNKNNNKNNNNNNNNKRKLSQHNNSIPKLRVFLSNARQQTAIDIESLFNGCPYRTGLGLSWGVGRESINEEL